LYTSAEAVRVITALVYPVVPDSAARIWCQLGLGDITKADLKDLRWGQLPPGTQLSELGPVFPRAEKEAITQMQNMEDQNAATKTANENKTVSPTGVAADKAAEGSSSPAATRVAETIAQQSSTQPAAVTEKAT